MQNGFPARRFAAVRQTRQRTLEPFNVEPFSSHFAEAVTTDVPATLRQCFTKHTSHNIVPARRTVARRYMGYDKTGATTLGVSRLVYVGCLDSSLQYTTTNLIQPIDSNKAEITSPKPDHPVRE